MRDQQPPICLFVVQLVQQIIDLTFRDRNAQMIGGHAFDGVCFIKNNSVVFRQYAGIITTQGQIRKEQSMIDDQQVSIPDAATGCVIEAVVVAGTFFAKAVAVIAEYFVPDIRFWLKGEIGSSTIGCLVSPLSDFCKLLLTVGFKQRFLSRTLHGLVEPPQANVVVASLHKDRRKFHRQHRL